MWLLAAGPDARGAGDDSSGPVLCCRSEALHVLGLQPGDRLALHPEGPGRVILVVPPSRGNATAAHTVAGGGGIGAPAAAAPPGPEPLLLTWNKELRVKVNLHEGRSDWIPLFPTETPLARGDGGRQPVPQEVVLWAPPQLAPVPAAARNPHAPVPLHFGLALNNPGRRGKYMMSTYRSRISGRMSQAPDGSVMAVMPGSRLVVAWWWPPAHNPAAFVEGGIAG
ncbi:hypothetical protein CHLRE_06g249550v5 [Chlamydomonas reinhardtii]|uniref:Uncharacterized protein n=1 Tax=Chlamydomonas reinhardtii TaxID=3055 RepID=A0A2K3DLU4_CHLRE|nr:uncharacterized protein CHLRE_06g249550v5 [Chlamydomonas reinhardtii]PNW81507.1 hypothetical protein CHLRE_06g249550v5 [Chlamydomonas reinhardtii]